MRKNFGNTTQEITNTVEMFMHGLCHIPALELNKQFGLPLLVVMDIDDEMDVLVHVANILDNGKIIDMQNTYENEDEFMQFIEEDFEELTEFTVTKIRNPNKLLVDIYNDCPVNVIQRDKKAQLILKEYIQEVSKLIRKADTKMNKEQAFNLIIQDNKEFYINHKSQIDTILKKNNEEILKLFFQSANSEYYPEISSFMIYIPVKYKNISAVIFSHYFCYIIENNKLKQIYKYKTNSITEANSIMSNIIYQFKLPKQFRELVLGMSVRYKLVALNPKIIREELYRRRNLINS